jgi:periplasmic copper chaperone A
MRLSLLAAAFAVALAVPAMAQQSPAVAVSNAWARATPPGAQSGVVYFTVTNGGAAADQILSASTPVAGKAQLHTTIDDNGVMKMRPIKDIDVKPGAKVTLKPDGMHLMLTELKGPLKEGESFPLALTFAKAGTVETTVTVKKIGAMGDTQDMPGMNMK